MGGRLLGGSRHDRNAGRLPGPDSTPWRKRRRHSCTRSSTASSGQPGRCWKPAPIPTTGTFRGMTSLHYMLRKNSDARHFAAFVKHGARGDIPRPQRTDGQRHHAPQARHHLPCPRRGTRRRGTEASSRGRPRYSTSVRHSFAAKDSAYAWSDPDPPLAVRRVAVAR